MRCSAYTALVPWTYFSNALNDSGGSLVKEVNMLGKIYFPRLILPLTSVLGTADRPGDFLRAAVRDDGLVSDRPDAVGGRRCCRC